VLHTLEKAAAEAKAKAVTDAIRAMFGKCFQYPASETLETLSMLGTLLGWLAEHLREVTVTNDPDEQRAALDTLARISTRCSGRWLGRTWRRR
jgi:hypothetical protein